MDGPLVQSVTAHVIIAVDLGIDTRVGQIGTVSPAARHSCDVPSELCSPGAMPGKWAAPLVTHFGIIMRV